MGKTLKVAELLESRIRSGGLLPSTQKIAADFAVSYKTAYQAVTELVDRKVAYRIKGKGAFALHDNLPNKVKTLGVLWGKEDEQKQARTSITFKEILMGINIQSGMEKLNIRHLVYHKKVEDEIADISDIDFALSLNCVWNDSDKQKFLEKIKCPHLYLEIWKPPTHNGSCLCIDTALSLRKALSYLTGLGKKNIAFVHRDMNEAAGRDMIFARIKAQMKLPHRPEWEIPTATKPVSFENAFEIGVKLSNEIIRNHPELDGVICVSDHIAAGIYSVSRKLKPGLAVMGMDNIEGMGYCPLGKPVLSCIAPDYFELGKQAVKILTNMPDHRSVTYLDGKLTIRRSCGE
jgi:DNA-binding LacI/PurR family transcriptional regulator